MFSLIAAVVAVCVALIGASPIRADESSSANGTSAPRALYEQAAAALAAGDHQTACTALRQLLAEHPDDKLAPLGAASLALTLRTQKNPAAVVDCLSSWLPRIDQSELMQSRYNEQRDQAHLHYALALEELGRTDDAIHEWQRLADEPYAPKIRLAALVHSSVQLIKQDPAAALKSAAHIKDLSSRVAPESIVDGQLEVVHQLLKQQHSTEALQLLESVPLDSIPTAKKSAIAFMRSECMLALRRYADAAAVLDQLLAASTPEATSSTRSTWLLRRCETALLMHEPAKVKQLAAELNTQQLAPERRHDVEVLLGRAAIEDVRFDEARDHFQFAAKISQEQQLAAAGKAAWFIGETYFFARDFAAATQAYSAAVEQFPKSEWTAAALLQRGKCRELQGDAASAEQDYRMIVQQFATSSWTKWAGERLTALGARDPAAVKSAGGPHVVPRQ
ncbi:MAG: tetratricopeptide repeat protein [Pirellulales bacterium]